MSRWHRMNPEEQRKAKLHLMTSTPLWKNARARDRAEAIGLANTPLPPPRRMPEIGDRVSISGGLFGDHKGRVIGKTPSGLLRVEWDDAPFPFSDASHRRHELTWEPD